MANIVKSEQGVVSYVPFGGADIELGEEAIVPVPDYCLLQYATGLPAQRPKLDSDGCEMFDEDTGEQLFDNLLYSGFFSECEKDKALDAAMMTIGCPWVYIAHGNGDVKRHWAICKPTVFIVARGVPASEASRGDLGMVYTWRQQRNSLAKRSVVYVQLMIRDLLPHYTKPLVFTCKSTQTRDILNILRLQYKALATAREAYHKATGRDIALPLSAYSLKIGPSSKPDRRGEGENSKTIFPMGHGVPEKIDAKYLQKHEMPLEYTDLLKEATEKSVEWATAKMAAIASGAEPHEPWLEQGATQAS